MKERVISEQNLKKVKIIFSLFVGIFFLYVGFVKVGQAGVKRSLIYLFFAVGGIMAVLLPSLQNKITIPLFFLFLLFAPNKMYQRMELPFHDMSSIVEGVPFVTLWLILCIFFLLYMITGRTNLVLGIGGTVLLVFFLANYFVFCFRGTIITPNDISAIGTAMTVAGGYRFALSSEAWYTCLYYFFFILWGFKIKINTGKRLRFVFSGVGVLFIGLFYFATMKTSFLEERDITGHYWNMVENQGLNGTLLSFLVIQKESRVEKPVGYSKSYLMELVQEEKEKLTLTEETEKPDIIMIMNEAWSDLSALGDIETSEDYLPFYHSMKNAKKGNLHVSILGGLTANTEFEGLTGNTLSLLAPTVIPYQTQVNHDMYSIARLLLEEGYETMGIHPSGGGAWSRDKVYAYLGMENRIFAQDFIAPYGYERNFISDECNFEEIIKWYKNRDKEKPFFLFDVTIQNHGGYYGEIDLPIAVTSINGKKPEEVGYTYDVQTYVNLMKITDNSFAKLISYFEKEDRPVIVCMFGDHQPILYEDTYSAVFEGTELSPREQNMKKYITPYVIWSNYEMTAKDYGDMSANYLPMAVLESAGMELSPFFQFLSDLHQEYPVLSIPGCIRRDGTVTDIKYIMKEPNLVKYRMFQYNQLYDKDSLSEAFTAASE